MKERGSECFCILVLVLISLFASPAAAQTPAAAPAAAEGSRPAAKEVSPPRDGQRDFDFLIGSWKYHLSRLEHPLTGATRWIEFDGTGVCRPVWKGNAQLDELEVDGPSGHIEGLTLRLYNPQSHQWNLNWANAKDATLATPTVGVFKNGRGEFYDQETWNGRVIFVRYVWSGITPNSAHFEQSFSEDGGKSWEVNWITDQVRVAK